MAQTAWCPTTATDLELAARSQAGQQAAFEALLARHYDSMYGLARYLLENPEDALDAVQESCVRAYESLSRYDRDRPFGPWLRGIVVHVCRDHGRRLRRRRVRAADVEQPDPPLAQARSLEGTELVQQAVRDALRTVPEGYRVPLVLFYLQEASVREIADTLGLRSGTVRVRLHRAREMMRKRLDGRLPRTPEPSPPTGGGE